MSKLRYASSLVLVTKNGLIKNPVFQANDVSTLTLKRSRKASHFPNSYVFPGGNCEPADESPDWLKLLPQSELNVQLNLIEQPSESANHKVLSRAVSRRITAIRETFEECGILLCKRVTDTTKLLAENYDFENRNLWRDRIRNDPFQFYNFCQINNCFPNLKSLHLLSNWITPTTYLKRFNSFFFIAAVDQEIESEADYKEIEEVKWGSVNSFIENKDIFLPPPQLYELTKLSNFANFEALCEFIRHLDDIYCEAYLPVHVNTPDGFIMILPGDEKYEEFSINQKGTTIELDCNIADCRGKVMNRVEYKYQENSNSETIKAQVIIQNTIMDDPADSSLRSKL